MANKITRGGLAGLIAGVGLAAIFPPLGTAVVIASTMGGAAIGKALEEEEEKEQESYPGDHDGSSAERLLDEFDRWDRKLSAGPPAASSPGVTSTSSSSVAAPHRSQASRTSRADIARLFEQLSHAEALLQSGQFLEAIDQFRSLKETLLLATEAAPPSDRKRVVDGLRSALHRLAAVLIENDSPAEAEELLTEALQLQPDSHDTLLHLGRLQLMLEHPDRAESYLRKAIELYPHDPEAYRLLAEAYLEQERVDDARSVFRSAQESAGDAAVSIEMLERISGLDPEDPNPLIELGKLQIQEGHWEQASRALREALARLPGDPWLQRRLGVLAFRLRNPEQGGRLLQGAPGVDEDVEASVELLHYYTASGDDTRALVTAEPLRLLERELENRDPSQRRRLLRERGLSGDQVEATYAPMRLRFLIDLAAVEARSGSLERAEEAARAMLKYGGTTLGESALAVTTSLAAEYGRRGDEAAAARWQEASTKLGGSLEQVKRERDTYEEFLRRFRYSAQDLIAEGGMARVYRGVDTRTGRTVAIKRMHDRFCTDPQAVAYFYREVRALEELSRPTPHPNIVEFIASGITESRFLFAMEYVEGPSLRESIDRGDSLPIDALCELIIAICSGLDRAHNSARHIIHRDLKPENVLLADGVTPKLTDFGICRVSSLFSASRRYYGSARSFVGTNLYSAPEQYPDPYSGEITAVDIRADIYSLGCIIYELLTGQPPFVSEEPGLIGLMHQRRAVPGADAPEPLIAPSDRNPASMARFAPELRAALDEMVLKCLELKPSRRYRSAAALSEAAAKLREAG